MADDATTWAEVCKEVGFSDNLYRTCREKVEDFQGFSNGSFDEGAPPRAQFDDKLVRSARPVPPPPPADWEPEPEGFFEAMDMEKMLLYGGLALVVVLWLMRNKGTPVAATTEPVVPGVTTPKAA